MVYKILSDESKKSLYDETGETDEESNVIINDPDRFYNTESRCWRKYLTSNSAVHFRDLELFLGPEWPAQVSFSAL